MHDDVPVAESATRQRLPSQSEPVIRTVVASVLSADAGAEASDYNDPSYFFLNWPTSV